MHLLSNPVFTCIVLAACMEIAVVAGFAAFLGKYLEQQFNLTTSSANQLLGVYNTHTHTQTHTCWFLWFTGTLHRRNGFYTVQAVCAIALHLPYT